MDFIAIRSRLADSGGRLYWRSLGELADTPEFREYLHREFPEQASEWNDPKGRRNFLKLMSASLALAGVGACTKQPPEDIVPYVRQPEDIIPGRPLFFASAISLAGIAQPVLVESHMGRPTKIEGNPDHPASLGGTDALTQAAVLDLYDPDRAQTVTFRGEVRPWGSFLSAMQTGLNVQRSRQGAGLRFLTPPITSPSLGEIVAAILRVFPQARWHHYDPVARPAAAVTPGVQPIYHFDRADVVVSLDADFLACGAGSVRYSRDFADRRRLRGERKEMNRLYAVESTPTLTGAKADHRLPLAASEIEGFARQLAGAVGAGTGSAGAQPAAPQAADAAKWVAALAKDLQAHRGRSVVVAGEFQPAAVHAAARAINESLGNAGTTVTYGAGLETTPAGAGTIAELAQAMEAGQVEVLVILGGNPAFTAPADLRFAERMAKVGLAIYHTTHVDETAPLCHWNVPETHALESWGDARAYDGTVTITQPLIAPLYEGRSAHELLRAFTGQPDRRAAEIIRDYWSRAHGGGIGGWTLRDAQGEPFRNTETFWRRTVHDGFIHGTGLTASSSQLPASGSEAPVASPEPPSAERRAPSAGPGASSAESGLEIIFRPDPTVWDGRFANNGWLQELPKPLSKVTWDATAWIAPRLAEERGLRNGDVIDLKYRGASARLPVFIVPGHPAQSVTVFFGYGRRSAGRVGNAVGTAQQFNAFLLRTSDAPWFGRGLEIAKTGENYPIASTQEHHAMEGRNPVRVATLEQYTAKPAIIHEMGHTPPRSLTLYPEYEYKGYKWGMAIDLSACTGCGACTVACVAENNIPVVGKEQVIRNREMHWIRVDHYYTGDSLDNPQSVHQPVPCMQCENAPCEVVCPVAATTHSTEGLNDMTYNRCVGTRYCSNNCPYKVRRFNFMLYADWGTQSFYPQRNPDVTVRSRGVMEKCTYCVQRINHARVDAKREERQIRDGEIVTACQGACPANAIVFGNMNDPDSEVNKLKAQERNYGLLEDLNTRPRTTYLAAIRNPNPELEPASAAAPHTGH
jgi:MoCo/4Fe-4S cofactor protein with predicted Tat translocation signal